MTAASQGGRGRCSAAQRSPPTASTSQHLCLKETSTRLEGRGHGQQALEPRRLGLPRRRPDRPLQLGRAQQQRGHSLQARAAQQAAPGGAAQGLGALRQVTWKGRGRNGGCSTAMGTGGATGAAAPAASPSWWLCTDCCKLRLTNKLTCTVWMPPKSRSAANSASSESTARVSCSSQRGRDARLLTASWGRHGAEPRLLRMLQAVKGCRALLARGQAQAEASPAARARWRRRWAGAPWRLWRAAPAWSAQMPPPAAPREGCRGKMGRREWCCWLMEDAKWARGAEAASTAAANHPAPGCTAGSSPACSAWHGRTAPGGPPPCHQSSCLVRPQTQSPASWPPPRRGRHRRSGAARCPPATGATASVAARCCSRL